MPKLSFKPKNISFSIVATLFLLSLWFVAAPGDYPSGKIIVIPEGMTLLELSERLETDSVVRSPVWFRTAAILLGGEHRMKAGEYYISRPQNVFAIAWRVLHGKHEIKTIKVTVPEGFNVMKISALFDERFPFFDNGDFERDAPEGYLFPDTYFVPITATAPSVIKMMQDNFDRHVSKDVTTEILVMASIIEGEVRGQTDREIVSGILWKRLSIDMPLQVDVEPSTYDMLGLPTKPINNPGLVSINAALRPTSTPYFYFLTDAHGTPHYSVTHDEHVAKKRKYLNRR